MLHQGITKLPQACHRLLQPLWITDDDLASGRLSQLLIFGLAKRLLMTALRWEA